MSFWKSDRPLWSYGVIIVFALLLFNLGFSIYATHGKATRKQSTTVEEVKIAYDRESLTVMRWDRIGVILKSKDGEVRTFQFDSEDVSFASSERKAGTALVECIVNADTGEPLWFKRVTLYVSPDDPLAEQEVQPLTEDDASSLENGMSP